MKRMIYQVAVGPSSTLYNYCIDSVAQYCKQYNIDHVIQRTPILRIKPDVFSMNRSPASYEKHGGFLPIYEKENAFAYFDQYDQIAIIDADIWIRSTAPNIFEDIDTSADFAGVVESSMPITAAYKQSIAQYSRLQYGSLRIDWKYTDEAGFPFMNMGLMVMNKSFVDYLRGQTPKQFIERPEFKRFVDGLGAWKWSTDQTLLNYWIRNEGMNIQDLDWKWNALYKAVEDKHIKDAHFVHFFKKQALPKSSKDIEKLLKIL